MAQAGLDLQAEPLLYHLNGAVVERPNVPLASAFHEAPYGFYAVQDGDVALSLSPMRQVSAALGDPAELAPYLDPKIAFERREEIYAALSPLLVEYTVAGLVERLRAHGVWCSPVNDYDAALAEPFMTHLEPIEKVEHPEAGQVSLLRHPVRYSSGDARARRLPPGLGEHTAEVLEEMGFTRERVRRLQDSGAIGGTSEHAGGEAR